jgi:hypothetical protein
MVFAVLVIEPIGEDGAVKLGSSSLREREGLPLFDSFDQAAPISARPTKTRWLEVLSLDWVAADGARSFSYATASFSSPGVPALLCRTFHVSHVFSGDAVRRGPRPLFG